MTDPKPPATMTRAEMRTASMLQCGVVLFQTHVETDPDDDPEMARENGEEFGSWWRTERAFSDYAEARAWITPQSYNYTGEDGKSVENRDWRLWSVPAMGSLAKVLETLP